MLAKAIELDPLLAPAYGPLAELELRSGDVDSAIRRLRRAVELEPDATVAHADLGLALLMQGNAPEAVTELRAALRADPQLLPVRNRLAWILATTADEKLRNGSEALALAQETCRMTTCRQPELLETLAAAHAASGDLGEAERVAADAIALARANNQAEVAERLERQRRSYRDGIPLREGAVTSERR
jgi:Flp pilus assembly protein TadD